MGRICKLRTGQNFNCHLKILTVKNFVIAEKWAEILTNSWEVAEILVDNWVSSNPITDPVLVYNLVWSTNKPTAFSRLDSF